MENKINIAELLKDCPKGMELYSPIFGTVYFEGIRDTGRAILIDVATSCNTSVQFYSDGKFNTYYSESEVTLFPSKSQRDWSKFQRPFKDGDVVTSVFQGVVKGTGIFNYEEQSEAWIHVAYHNNEFFTEGYLGYVYNLRLATEEEKQKLFGTIKANGYKWNDETKTLEKLVEPIFKVGDRIRHKEKTKWTCMIKRIDDVRYWVDKHPMCFTLPFGKQDEYELVPNKFDITTLKPFESRVLVRDSKIGTWKPAYWGFYDKTNNMNYPYVIVGGSVYGMGIPYENNEHLLNTTDDCDEFYKTWENDKRRI